MTPKKVLGDITIRQASAEDGWQLHQLIERCPPLDQNSAYCNLLQCHHFSQTSAAAWLNGELVGFISGYLLPEQNNCLFIWQVAVDEAARGRGLAVEMLKFIASNNDVSELQTSITQSNQSSWAMFKKFANAVNAELKESVLFDKERHFNGQHDSEALVTIGPFSLQQANAA
jgi:L-2,4-diaminobutyric acid acetyltransferase